VWVSVLNSADPLTVAPGEMLLRSLLFWAMFLPLGASYSLDSALNTSPQALPQRFGGAASFALRVQISGIYLFSALAQGLVTSAESSGRAWSVVLGLLWVGTWGVLWPARLDRFRTLTILAFVLLHLSFGLTFNQDMVTALSIVTWLAFLPSAVWEGWRKRCYGAPQAGLALYYDADCGFCKKVVHGIRTVLLLPSTPLYTAQSDAVICAAMEQQNSWVVVDWQGQHHYKFEAIAYVCSLSPVFRILTPLLRWAPVMAAGTHFYEAIANNRRRAGLLTRPFQFHPFQVKAVGWLDTVVLALVLLMLLGNCRGLTDAPAMVNGAHRPLVALRQITHSPLAEGLYSSLQAIGLAQSWDIFAAKR
jgi:predicted DCC family thiol-disulfide oxidoreductase YuxK